ncbi:MAG: excinuclease ABC subunit UvrC [bacterium]|nr:excinuclease ABC subunit UvrC [bacterium]
MSDNLTTLRKRVTQAPSSPGVYRWINAKGEVLYIGKAKNLQNRLKSYVQKEPDKALGPWKLSLISHITDFDVTITQNELEALILETNMIKEVKPKYNVLMKDDKNYVYIRITKEQYPLLEVVRQMDDDNARYFGPYLSAYNIKRTLDTLHEVFHFRACKKSVDHYNKQQGAQASLPACLQYQIGQCNGLCVGDVSQKQYIESIEAVMRFLKGDHTDAVIALKDMMENAAQNNKFEKAAKLRDTLIYIESLNIPQVVSDTSRENTDAIGIALQHGKAQVVVLRERNGRLVEERAIALAGEADNINAVLSEFLPQYYSVETDIPDLILIQEEIEDLSILEAWLIQIREKQVEIRSPERGKKSKLLALAISNANQKVSQQFAKWEAQAQNINTALKELQNILGSENTFKRIEGYDISHLGGTETVGSMVVIKNGKPANKEYRSFTIRTVKEGEVDDYKALKEVLGRRLKYLEKHDESISISRLKKKERDIWAKTQKDRLEVPKDWKEEVIIISKGEADLLTLDARKSTKGKTIYGTLTLHASDRDLQHSALDMLEDKAGKLEWYVQCNVSEDLASIHGLTPSVKPIPDAFTPGKEAVLHRRATTEDFSLKSIPDLLVIDGGKGQLSTVVEVLKDLKLEIPVIGLAKREEEVFLPGESFPVDLPKDSQASFLLQRLRNEAHRFANAHREKRIAKVMIGSALDDVPGIGEKTKKELLQKFGSVDAIQSATDSDLLVVVSEAQLAALRESLQ